MRLERISNPRPFILNWAEQVKLRMTDRGWNLKHLAEELGKSPQFLSQLLSAYAHGSRRPIMPSYEIVKVIDEKLGFSKEQQYQVLGLISSNQVGLGGLMSTDNDSIGLMQDNHTEYERQIGQEQRIEHLEAQVRLLAEQLNVDISTLTETR